MLFDVPKASAVHCWKSPWRSCRGKRGNKYTTRTCGLICFVPGSDLNTSCGVPGAAEALCASCLQPGWQLHDHVLTAALLTRSGESAAAAMPKSVFCRILWKQLPVSRRADTPGWSKSAALWAISALATWTENCQGSSPGSCTPEPRLSACTLRALCNAGRDIGPHMSPYTEFTWRVKQAKTHLSITIETNSTVFLQGLHTPRAQYGYIYSKKKVIPALKCFQAQ